MSDLLAPVDIRSIPSTEERQNKQFLQLLRDIRTELRVLNTHIEFGLNTGIVSDDLRQDPYYYNPDYDY